ncbi:Aste57867_11775 [Aphanomyces stellatus]|uniref:RNA helicase n=1 Tax=Aphanomyces stellatus TaxID=120398 RepID=A0A485KTV9_9STRA|nr:hypothetical protein As57867_011730 [Aphanomyces stellatus]VFT88631.1 Aste57867_11775 [Aphanomyces stellatus]
MDQQETEAASEIVLLAEAQRYPQDQEPACVFCGRYGEYICDKTDEDVCSMECRDRATERAAHRELQRKFGMTVSGAGIDLPLATEFHQLKLHEDLRYNMRIEGYHHPTPVQMQVLPHALNHRHVVVHSPTGTGKTMAFLIPLVSYVMEHRFDVDDHRILGLVIAPIRELCVQLETQAKTLMAGITKMKTALLVGGVPMPNQLHRLHKGVQVVIATPGRLEEHLAQHQLDLSHVVCCVLDEVDMLLDRQAGFADVIGAILTHMPQEKQMLLVSATITPAVRAFAQAKLHEAIQIEVGAAIGKAHGGLSVTAKQDVQYMVSPEAKKRHLFDWLRTTSREDTDVSILVFVASKQGADMLAKSIVQSCDMIALSIHGDKTQTQRLAILQSFVDHHAPVLVSTYLLGRGMDLLHVDHVVVFDMPPTIHGTRRVDLCFLTSAEYIHLVGRAGRRSKDDNDDDASPAGLATVYLGAENAPLFRDLIPLWRASDVAIPSEVLQECIRQRTLALSQRQNQVQDESKRAFRATQEVTNQASKWQQWTQTKRKEVTTVVVQAETQHKKFKFISSHPFEKV